MFGTADQQPSLCSTETAIPDERVYVAGNSILARGLGRQLPPWSILIYCPVCGEVWARVVRTAPRLIEGPCWAAAESVCVAHFLSHGTPWFVPGTILPALRSYAAGLGRDYEWADNLPAEVIRHDAKLALEWWWTRRRVEGMIEDRP